MGAKTTMFVVASGDAKPLLAGNPKLDRNATLQSLAEYFPGRRFTEIGQGSLDDTYVTSEDEVYIGNFGSVLVMASVEFAHDRPSEIDPHFFKVAGSRSVYTHTMHSAVDFLAFSYRKQGQVVRSLSLAPDSGIMEDTGTRLPFEEPFWAGDHPVDDPEDLADPEYEPYPFAFHPLELGEAVLSEFFGYQLEGSIDPSMLDASSVPLLIFKRA
jgi:hypothetical protein